MSTELIIDENNTVEEHLHVFSAEASELGFRPGEWPNMIRTPLGNRQQFLFHRKITNADGDLEVAIYRQIGGCIELHILND
jgi:hypothetical protein